MLQEAAEGAAVRLTAEYEALDPAAFTALVLPEAE